MASRTVRLLTADPATGHELIVTRLECPESGVVIEGRFSLGWMGRLTPEQLEFVGVLLRSRNNLQKVASDLGVAYNTARARFDDVVAAVGGVMADDATDETNTDETNTGDDAPRSRPGKAERAALLDALASGEVDVDEALRRLT